MGEQFKVGEICVGQNFINAQYRNGMECKIVGALKLRQSINSTSGKVRLLESYLVQWADGDVTAQRPFFLRRKRPPTTGEDAIMALFNAPPVERRQPVTAWQAQYDTAQALMKMGVRVKPGVWPVEVV
jgi:hypothetical protein